MYDKEGLTDSGLHGYMVCMIEGLTDSGLHGYMVYMIKRV